MAEPTPEQGPEQDQAPGEPDAATATEDATAVDAQTPEMGTAEAAGAGAEPAVSGKRRMSSVWLVSVVGLVLAVALGGMVGWLGYRTYNTQQDVDLRELYLEAGREGAFNLTNVSWEQAEADVQRILDSATGSFYDDMERRAPSYTELVKQAQSKSVGEVTEVGLESYTDTEAEVLAAVIINAANVGVPEQPPQAWRMRLTVQKVGDEAKVSTVGFVQ